ncbi:MAG: hypothetical protein RSF34_20650 [Flavobacterium sp.]|uniref:hypothetical protein n=1 Tax=Flavobacterium sp. TaxID=239 RepID=UPI002FC9D764
MATSQKSLQTVTRILTAISGIAMFVVLLVPIWQIQLSAPQYPEGLSLYIHADKLSGDVNIINGLNHYIGMRELHEQDFIEFAILPYVIIFLGILGVLAAVVNRKWLFFCFVIMFAVFGIVAIIDFYMWLYDYGHNLDPAAPIKVPGMSYQPPLIGFKQLLNFGAYSIPEKGGWIMITAALLSVIAVIKEIRSKKKKI